MLADASPSLMLKGEPLLPLVLSPDFEFTLTGSHYFGNAKPTSDYDFIAQDSPALRTWLQQVGFVEMTPLEYEGNHKVPKKGIKPLGSGTAAIYQKQAQGLTAQVQLSPHAAHKVRVRDLIKQNPDLLAGHGVLDKEKRGTLWSVLFDTLALANS